MSRDFQTTTSDLSLRSVAGLFLVGIVAFGSPAQAKEGDKHDTDKSGPGCASDRPSIAHYAGAVIARSKAVRGGKAPIPCATPTGFRTGEVSMTTTNEGALIFQPAVPDNDSALPIGLLRSDDLGATWMFIDPKTPPPARSGFIDMDVHVDRDTDRLFWSRWPQTNQFLDRSDDEALSWTPSSKFDVTNDHTQIFTGPPPSSLRRRLGKYPNMVYVCMAGGGSPGPHGQYCMRSFDGGKNFEAGIPVPFPAECPAPPPFPPSTFVMNTMYGLRGIVERDGTIYLPLTPCNRPYVAISQDGAQTWQLNQVADTRTIGWGELPLGRDQAGNFYAVWVDAKDRLPYFVTSRDDARHWSAPLMIGAPGVNEAAIPLLVAGKRGEVSVTYYGSTNAPKPFPKACQGASLRCPGYEHETWNTYITETLNGLDRSPLFWTATLNDPRYPTWYGLTPSSIGLPRFTPPPLVVEGDFVYGSGTGSATGGAGGRLDYYGMTRAPDGTAWVGYAQECPFGQPVPGNPNCPSTLKGRNHDGLFGFVGRLVREHGDDRRDDD